VGKWFGGWKLRLTRRKGDVEAPAKGPLANGGGPRIEFAHAAHRMVYEKVRLILRQLFGELAAPDPVKPLFVLRYGRATVHIYVDAWGDDDASVGVFAWVAGGLHVTGEMASHLLRENTLYRYGGFAVDTDGELMFRYSVPGATCSKDELKSAVMAVAVSADRADEEVLKRYGAARIEA